MSSPEYRLSLKNVTKTYPGIVALDDITFNVKAGEVHGLLGENGAGKSTMLNILSGVRPGDQGQIEIDGKPVEIHNPIAAREAGIAMIHQELQHVPELSVAQNMFLGRPLTSAGRLFVRTRAQEQRARDVLADLDPTIDPAAPIKTLKVAQQQIVEIGRALLEQASIIAMDEPTSSLTPSEFERLAELIKTLSEKGVSIIYVSHKMDEVFQVCQRATILRDGKHVAVVDIADETENSIVSKMVGREVLHAAHTSYATAEEILAVDGLGRGKAVIDADFTLHRGEVLGISGLVGSGRTELLRLIAGLDQPSSGNIRVMGKPVRAHDPRAAIRAGIGLVPEERKREGIIHARSVASNMALPSMGQFTRSGLLRHGLMHKKAEQVMSDLRLRPPNVRQAIGTFSGGNQQKAIIGRWLAASTEIFLFDEPTRGIDVGAKSEIYNLIEELAKAGKAIIVVSSEMPEIIRLSDRVLVMQEGRLVANLQKNDITEDRIAHYAIPRKDQAVA
ncbi:sugar ABC transporter ATP-binding protein [Pararhizobium sp. IMCC21322]|uniref:sugar ABC transporter ATP-binding protein n=1 Tax=Pararhizobium sp. IMCC21322 TaxID=3067903 RepID=UPI0027424D56|nr:sugar ABC transporter ATP-binding protein [Pararhizobium sp. IMCC21322]